MQHGSCKFIPYKCVNPLPCILFALCINIIIFANFNEHATYNLNVGSNSSRNRGGSQAWGHAISRWGQNVPTQESNIECQYQCWPNIIKCIGYQHA